MKTTIALFVAFLLAGCASFRNAKLAEERVEQYQKEVKERPREATHKLLQNNDPKVAVRLVLKTFDSYSGDKHANVRAGIVNATLSSDPERNNKQLRRIVDKGCEDPSRLVRRLALNYYLFGTPPDAAVALEKMLDSRNPEILMDIQGAIAQIEKQRAVKN